MRLKVKTLTPPICRTNPEHVRTQHHKEGLQVHSAYITGLKRKQDDELDAKKFHSAPSQWKLMAVPDVLSTEEILGRPSLLLNRLLGYISEVWGEEELFDKDPL